MDKISKPHYLIHQVTAILFSFLLINQATYALGGDHSKQKVSSNKWPKGMSELVNSPERVHGYFVNAEDVFFFVGNQKSFNQALEDYAKIDGVVQHKIVIHEGAGRAKSPWQKNDGKKCDWMIYSCPASWKGKKPKVKGFILEFHIWKDGRIKMENFILPKGVRVERVKDTKQN